MALLKHERPLWFPDTYSFYPTYCKLYDIAYQPVPLADDCLCAGDYLPNGEAGAGAIVFANPNAPTGRFLPLSEVERIVAGNPDAVVMVDEAYVDFGGQSAVALVNRYPNLLVVHTFQQKPGAGGFAC